ncbi:MAG TPA: NAD-dependent epimerase/dehydratase family protein [Polyangiaceae bacterium]|jgi:dihydroflavonol-4-reductase|nr:NAD-dependent epimerase/dehydratase family protein [Polyangiaceae bacterium]
MAFTLVTGATGFLGSQLVRTLLDRGESVKAFVRPGSNLTALSGYPSDRFKLAVGDIRIEQSVFAALANCSRMYHVAANFKMWDPDPSRIILPAVEGMRATLRAARSRKLEKVVITSSAGVLGTTKTEELMDETHAFNLSDPEAYFAAKVAADQVAAEFVAEGLPLVLALPATIAGPGDWKPTPNGQLLLEYLKTPPTSQFPVSGGGINVVDVEDVAEGHVLAMERGVVGERYLLGGENLTFSKLFETLADLTGLAEPSAPKSKGVMKLAGKLFELNARLRGGDPRITSRLANDYVDTYSFVTCKKAEDTLGYRHRSAREALARSVRWFLAHGYVPTSAAARVRMELRPA